MYFDPLVKSKNINSKNKCQQKLIQWQIYFKCFKNRFLLKREHIIGWRQ